MEGTSYSFTVCFILILRRYKHQKLERKAENRECLIPQVFQDMISLEHYLKPTNQVDAGVLVLKTTYKNVLMNGERVKTNTVQKNKNNNNNKNNKESV